MQYLVMFTGKQKFEVEGLPADHAEQRVAEMVQGQVLYAQGDIRQSWAIDAKPEGAVCIFEAQSLEHLQGMIDSLPFVKSDYVDHRVIPLKADPAYTQGI